MGGTITAAIENAAGSAFRIYCATGGEIPRGGFEYETKAFDYETKSVCLDS